MAGSAPVWTIEPDFAKLQAELAKVAAREAAVTVAADKLGVSQKEVAKAMTAVEQAAAKEARAVEQAAAKQARAAEQAQAAAQKAAERAARGPSEWTLALQANAKALQEQKGAINQGAEAIGRVGSALSAVDPILGSLAANAQKAVGVFSAGATAAQGLGATLGAVSAVALPLTAVVAGLALAWQSYENDIKAAEEATRAAREEQERMTDAMGGIRSVLDASATEIDKLKVNYGRMTEAQFEAAEINRKYAAQLEQTRAPLEKIRDELQRNIDGSEEHGQKIAAVEAALRSADEANRQGLSAALENAEIERERAEAERVLAERLKAKQQAERASTEAAREAAEVERELAELADRRARNMESDYQVWLRDAQAEADARKLAYEATKAAEEAKREEFRKTLALAEENRKRAEQARQEDLEAVQEYTSEVESIVGSANDIVDLIYDKRVSNTEDLYDRYEQALEDGDEATAKSLKKQYEAEKEGALKAFKVNKALAITAATLSSVVAVAKALEAGWPAALVTVPAAAAAGAAQIAAAAMQEPPEFDDTPQVMRAVSAGDDGRVPISAKRNDLVAMAQTPDGLRSQIDRLDGGGGGRREILAERMNRTLAGRTVTRDLRAVTRGIWRSA